MKIIYIVFISCALLVSLSILVFNTPQLKESKQESPVTVTDSIAVLHEPIPLLVTTDKKIITPTYPTYNTTQLHIEKPIDAYRYDNIQLYPVYASKTFLDEHLKLGPYLSLSEALKQSKLLISELENGSEVNTLYVENISRDTIIVLGGEVVRGGKQDRMIAQDFMVMPNKGKVDISVFCVEHNRWASEKQTELFEESIGIAPNSIRQAAQESDAQMMVWSEVAELNAAYDVEETTEALAYAISSEDMKDDLQPYLDELGSITWPSNVVGVIAVMDKKIVGCDIFAQHKLFARYYQSLLRSYCGNLHEAKYEDLMTFKEVKTFFQDVLINEVALEARIEKRGTQLKSGPYRIHASIY